MKISLKSYRPDSFGCNTCVNFEFCDVFFIVPCGKQDCKSHFDNVHALHFQLKVTKNVSSLMLLYGPDTSADTQTLSPSLMLLYGPDTSADTQTLSPSLMLLYGPDTSADTHWFHFKNI